MFTAMGLAAQVSSGAGKEQVRRMPPIILLGGFGAREKMYFNHLRLFTLD